MALTLPELKVQLTESLRGLIHRTGFDLRRYNPDPRHVDAYRDQAHLLRGREVSMVFDVGANVGQTVSRYRALFPAARIHSFEPFAEGYATLVQNHGADAHVRAHQLAVGSAPGTQQLYSNKDSVTNSLFAGVPDTEVFGVGDMMEPLGSVAVEVVTLDGFCAREGIGHLDVLKMDIQGGELQALRGAEGLLAARAIDLVYTEVIFCNLYQGQAYFHEINAHFGARGYELYGLYNYHHLKNGLVGWGDAIFLSPSMSAAAR